MNKNAQPLDYILLCLEQGTTPSDFDINNAKDELKKLRLLVDNLLSDLYKPVAWARINERGDLYDLRFHYNPYIDPKSIVPLCIKNQWPHS